MKVKSSITYEGCCDLSVLISYNATFRMKHCDFLVAKLPSSDCFDSHLGQRSERVDVTVERKWRSLKIQRSFVTCFRLIEHFTLLGQNPNKNIVSASREIGRASCRER